MVNTNNTMMMVDFDKHVLQHAQSYFPHVRTVRATLLGSLQGRITKLQME